MSWQPKRFDPPGYKGDGDEDEPHVCPKCSWADWEICVWGIVFLVAFYVGAFVVIHGWVRP